LLTHCFLDLIIYDLGEGIDCFGEELAVFLHNSLLSKCSYRFELKKLRNIHMQLSRESQIVCGILLIAVPGIMYGGVTLLGILTEGIAGMKPGNLTLDDRQWSLWRAGHAHAGVYAILALVLQPLVDQTAFSNSVKWVARLGAPIASVVVPIGFFGLAFVPDFRWVMYIGIFCLAVSMLLTGIGLLRNLRPVV